VLAKEPDFQAQRGRLVEELEALNQRVMKFHCELNFIERFWCSAKFYPRENRLFSLGITKEALRFIPCHDQSVLQAMHVDVDSI
jgi:hypothetical protein